MTPEAKTIEIYKTRLILLKKGKKSLIFTSKPDFWIYFMHNKKRNNHIIRKSHTWYTIKICVNNICLIKFGKIIPTNKEIQIEFNRKHVKLNHFN